jgi:hypothetical protein
MTVTVRELRNIIADLNKKETNAKLYQKSPNMQASVQGDLQTIRAGAAQARHLLYDYLQKRTGIDVGPLKANEQALMRLKDTANDVSNKAILKGAQSSTALPNKQPPTSIGRKIYGFYKAGRHPILTGVDKVLAQKQATEPTPLDEFNRHMQEVVKGSLPQGNPSPFPVPTVTPLPTRPPRPEPAWKKFLPVPTD